MLVLPLYPQYCAATTASTFDAVTNVLQKWRWIPELRFINQYYEEESYIKALSKSIEDFWKKMESLKKQFLVIMVFQKNIILKGDPYHCFCLKTTRLVKEYMN